MKKRNKVIYWIATLWLALGMLSTGIVQLLEAKEGPGGLDMMAHLGYPDYLLKILGICKILGVVVLLVPRLLLLKEWAYAGFFFIMTGAIFSHFALSDPGEEIFPAVLLLLLTIVSWYFRPATRRMNPNTLIL